MTAETKVFDRRKKLIDVLSTKIITHINFAKPISLCPIGVDVLQKKTIFEDSKDSPQSTKGGV